MASFVAKKEDAKTLVETTINQFGKLDILVNNAGVSSSMLMVEIEPKEWNLVFNVNVKGVYLCSLYHQLILRIAHNYKNVEESYLKSIFLLLSN